MRTYTPGLNSLPLYAPVCFRHDTPLALPACVLYGWPLRQLQRPRHGI